MINKESLQDKNFLYPFQNNIAYLNPLFDKEKYISKNTQSLLLKQFINPEINILSEKLMNEVAINIFNPVKNNETFEDVDKPYFINQNKENIQFSPDILLSPDLNTIEKNIIIEIKANSFEKNKKNNSRSRKSQYISKKRKNAKNNLHTNRYFKKMHNEINSKYNYRLDYYKKAFKSSLIKSLTKFLNKLIFNCNFPKPLKNKKIFKPNSKDFSANVNNVDNFEFLNKSLSYIFCYFKEGGELQGKNLQKKNKKFIEMILNFNPVQENMHLNMLKYYLKMRLEDYIKEYYKSDDFKAFCKKDIIKFYENEFMKEKKFGLLSENGFINLIKNNSIKNFSN